MSTISRLIVIASLATGLCAAAAQAVAAPQGGIFIPRNGGYEARLADAHAYINQHRGGTLALVGGEWPRFDQLARLDLVFRVRPKDGGPPVEVRQSFDRNPEVLFLEEGQQRLGVRVRFKLYDAQDTYHGHGMNETWFYPDGQTFVTLGVSFENQTVQERLEEAYAELTTAEGTTLRELGVANAQGHAAQPIALNDEQLPGRFAVFGKDGRPGVGLYWRTGRMQHNTFIYRPQGSGAPFYYRWPDFLRQTYTPSGTGVAVRSMRGEGNVVRLDWPVQKEDGKPQMDFTALFRLSAGVDAAGVRRFVEAEREPVKLALEGGVIHGDLDGYNDQEGAYEVRKTGPASEPMTITLPADPAQRTITVKALVLNQSGAVTTLLDDKPLVPQLVSQGGIADDPLAPIREQPEGCADMAVLTIPLTGKPQTLVVREVDGVQLAYQMRDEWRSFASFSTQGGPRFPGVRFSPVDGRARNMRAHGQREWALTENLLTWFSYCGFSPQQMVDQLRDFVILKNGPDEVVFKYTSTNADQGALSEYTVRIPADAPGMTMNVAAKFTVAKQWPFPTGQFFDVFPFRGVWPQDWWYANVLWLAPDGRWKTMRTVEATFDGDKDLHELTTGGFFALYSSDRGNMLMLTRNFSPELPTQYTICGNYIDYHMDVQFLGPEGKPAPPAQGFTASVEYELMLWGDEGLTRDQLIEIGNKSVRAQKIVVPD